MKLCLSALAFAAAPANALAIVVHIHGAHSTPGIWMAVANFPGTVFGVWTALLTRKDDLAFYTASISVNSAFYFVFARGFVWLKCRLTRLTSAR